MRRLPIDVSSSYLLILISQTMTRKGPKLPKTKSGIFNFCWKFNFTVSEINVVYGRGYFN